MSLLFKHQMAGRTGLEPPEYFQKFLIKSALFIAYSLVTNRATAGQVHGL